SIVPSSQEHTQSSYALFFGLVLACVWIPYSTAGLPWRPGHYIVALVGAVLAFVVMGMPRANLPVTTAVIFVTAAVAICALGLPGMSGSFILLSEGMY